MNCNDCGGVLPYGCECNAFGGRSRSVPAARSLTLDLRDPFIEHCAEVEAVQAQPASITESLPICTKVPLVFAQPASAPMGEPSVAANALEALQAVINYFWCAERESGGLREWDVEGLVREAESALRTNLAAQARMPLSEEQIDAAFQTAFPGHDLFQESIAFARAIESAHGISGESSGAARKDGVRPTDGGQQ